MLFSEIIIVRETFKTHKDVYTVREKCRFCRVRACGLAVISGERVKSNVGLWKGILQQQSHILDM